MINISAFHAHIYFEPTNLTQAESLCAAIADQFDIKIGRFHHQPVGPHPMNMVQVVFDPNIMGKVVSFIALNRHGLIIFIHPITGNALADHTEHAMWMGEVKKLNLAVFN